MFNFLNVYAQGINPWGSCVTPEGVPTLKCLEVVFGNIIFMASAFIILVLFIMFLVGAFQYLTSFGDAEKVKKARGTFKYALIGFFLFIGSYLILNTICFLFLGGIGDKCSLMKFEIPGP